MSLKTHPDFKSVDPLVANAEDMCNQLFDALSYQFLFHRRTTPRERDQWGDGDLRTFEIDLELVDRLYDIDSVFKNRGSREWVEMIGRMQYKGDRLYVKLTASYDYTGFRGQVGGVIFVSRDACLFMRLVLVPGIRKDRIYKSLVKDGIEVGELSEFDSGYAIREMFWNNVPRLKYICYEAIYQKQQQLQSYLLLLPKILANSIDEFIRLKEAQEDYENICIWWKQLENSLCLVK